MAWAGIFLFLMLIAPVRVGARLRWEGELPRLAVGAMVWGARLQIDLKPVRSEGGRLRLAAQAGGKRIALPKRKKKAAQGLKALWLLLRANGAGARLRRMVKVRALEGTLRLGGQDAAALALTAGFLRSAAAALPFAHVRVDPALGGRSAVYARCIAETRLGILMAAGLLWYAQRRKAGRKEEKAWIIPSGT